MHFLLRALAESASRSCPFYSFQCDDGTCVDLGADCNGKEDCADGSDESDELCKPVVVSSNPSEETGSCVLPSYPGNGRYVVQNVTNARPGQRLENFVLTIICSEGYDIMQANGVITRDKEIHCYNGVWSEQMPKCIPADCIWEGIRGQCVPSSECLSALDDSLKRPALQRCSSSSDKTPSVCCTDCELIKDSSLLLTNPVLGILVKTGTSKAKDKCLEYINTLDYPCKKDSSLRNITVQLDPVKNCYRKVNVQPSRTHYKGRRDALREEFPHMALLGFETPEKTDWKCNGAVISERFVLTAALCLIDRFTNSPVKYIAVGMLSYRDPPELWQRYNVKRAIPHPKYIAPHKYHNIALLETDKEIAFSSAVLPACLQVDDESDTDAYFTGWARRYSEGFSVYNTLQCIYEMRFSTEECQKKFPPTRTLRDGYVNTTQMCYGQKDETGSTCEVKASGSLTSQDHEQCVFTLIGVLSFGLSCTGRGEQNVYSRVKYYVPWIEEIVWPFVNFV
ncbi:unnamed protein product [Arctia plantaginis]|uniref:Uncharacterized protein n=1 Tax=Arctia plantaginis TaxID=874455 RepID=A0A8S0YXW5_ARCPL|nr:unnamed protein product [Arctia plantaginis]